MYNCDLVDVFLLYQHAGVPGGNWIPNSAGVSAVLYQLSYQLVKILVCVYLAHGRQCVSAYDCLPKCQHSVVG